MISYCKILGDLISGPIRYIPQLKDVDLGLSVESAVGVIEICRILLVCGIEGAWCGGPMQIDSLNAQY